jgi:hypothetical protein
MTKLEHLKLFQNQISGTLPSWLSELTSLREISVVPIEGATGLYGTIPNELRTLHLEYFALDGNSMTGPIPDWVKDIGFVHLRGNLWSGPCPVPDWITNKQSSFSLICQSPSGNPRPPETRAPGLFVLGKADIQSMSWFESGMHVLVRLLVLVLFVVGFAFGMVYIVRHYAVKGESATRTLIVVGGIISSFLVSVYAVEWWFSEPADSWVERITRGLLILCAITVGAGILAYGTRLYRRHAYHTQV